MEKMWSNLSLKKSSGKSGYQPINPESDPAPNPSPLIFHYKSTFIDELFALFSFFQITGFLMHLLNFTLNSWTEWDNLDMNSQLILTSILTLYSSVFVLEFGLTIFQHKSIQQGRASFLGRWLFLSFLVMGFQFTILYFAPIVQFTTETEIGDDTNKREIFLDYQSPLFVLWRYKMVCLLLSCKIYRYLKSQVSANSNERF